MKTYIDVTDPGTGEVFPLRSDQLVGNIRDLLLSRRRMDLQATTWAKLSQEQQQGEINAAAGLAEHVVNAVVELVAQAGRPVIHAHLKKYGVKDGVVELTASGVAEDDVVLSLNRVGKMVIKIIVADADQFDQKRAKVQADPDQPSLPIKGAGEINVEVRGKTITNKEALETVLGEIFGEPDSDASDELDASDADDLHDEPQDEDEGGTEGEEEPNADEEITPTSAASAGFAARLQREKVNPYDDGTADYFDWDTGYDEADNQIYSIRVSAIEALELNQDCTYKPGGFAATLWGQVQAAHMAQVPDNATKSGMLAAEDGLPLDANPFLDKPLETFWAEGWQAFTDRAKKKGA